MAQKMKLYLTKLPSTVLGVYGSNGDHLAERMRFLHPEAARSFMEMENDKRVICSDMFRSADASLRAVKNKAGSKRPAFSAHNFGLAIDLSTTDTRKRNSFKNKPELDEYMNSYGWYCHVPKWSNRSFESWHYNYLGKDSEKYLQFRKKSRHTWDQPVEAKIQEFFSHFWKDMELKKVQELLKSLGIYSGDIDGDNGSLTKEAVKVFQRAWELKVDGIPGPMTQRTLSYVSAEKVLVDGAC